MAEGRTTLTGQQLCRPEKGWPSQELDTRPHPSRPLADYAGTYRNACYGDIRITVKDDALYFDYNKKNSPCTHFHYETFQISDVKALFDGMNFAFATGKTGKVDSLSFGIVLNPLAKDEVFTRVEA